MAFEDFKVNEWANDFWLDLSNAYLWNTDANKDILNENSFPFPIFVATAYDSANNQDFFPVENTREWRRTDLIGLCERNLETSY